MGKIKSDLNFCTLFDSNYFAQGVTMINSLFRANKEAQIFVAAMDMKAYNLLSKIDDSRLRIIRIAEIEELYKDFKNTKSSRSIPEYYYSSKGFICHYFLSKNNHLDSITYIDSDLYFFSNPQPIFDELQGASVGITRHNFHWLCLHQKKYGVFNAGWVTFKNDKQGLQCLEDWMQDCINWCFGYLDGEKYADQKYLNAWQKKYSGVQIIQSKGANAAPWNIKKYSLKILKNSIHVDEDILIFYHFSNLKKISPKTYKTNLSRVFVRTKGIIKDRMYIPYINELSKNEIDSRQMKIKNNNNISFFQKIRSFERSLRTIFYKDILSI